MGRRGGEGVERSRFSVWPMMGLPTCTLLAVNRKLNALASFKDLHKPRNGKVTLTVNYTKLEIPS